MRTYSRCSKKWLVENGFKSFSPLENNKITRRIRVTDGGQIGIGHKGIKAKLTRRGKGRFGEPIVEEQTAPKGACMLVIITDKEKCRELERMGLPNIGHIIGVKNNNFEVSIPGGYPWVDQYRRDELKFPDDFKKQE